ncbi:hypothetical protein HWV62_20075 [Athelia sp. TMB]|nr:hypothetical protein HWV62_25534 [Athelia sp. TMB]KAF7971715.1 hypothetical protein HWV62_20075 [Athelia sp. TMB]
MAAPSTTPNDYFQKLPTDLTGQVVYLSTGGIYGGHGHVGQGIITDPAGCKITVAVKVVTALKSTVGYITSAERHRFDKASFSTPTANFTLRVRREKKVWEILNHKNVVPLLGITMDCPFSPRGSNPLAMISPWMSQGNLFKALESDPPPERRLHLLRGVAEGLEHHHLTTAKANVLIDDDGNACLTDFGLSFIVPDFIDTSYWSRSVGGAMRWRAPELIPASPTAEIESAGDLTTMSYPVISLTTTFVMIAES